MEKLDNLALVIYIVEKLNSTLALTWVVICLLVLALAVKLTHMDNAVKQKSEENIKYWSKFGFKRYTLPLCPLLLLALALPNQTSAYKILAVYTGVEIIQNPEIQAVSGKGLKVIDKVLNTYLDSEN
jgi:hypothetical protein